MTLKNNILRLICGLTAVLFSSCYTFTGSSLDPSIKTMNISTFPNYATLQNINLSMDFTTALQNRFHQRTKLVQTTLNPDINIEGEITNYAISPIDVQAPATGGADVAARNRLTITIKVRYDNQMQPEKSFEKTYSDYADYDATQMLSSVEDNLCKDINQRIIDQIFNDIVADW